MTGTCERHCVRRGRRAVTALWLTACRSSRGGGSSHARNCPSCAKPALYIHRGGPADLPDRHARRAAYAAGGGRSPPPAPTVSVEVFLDFCGEICEAVERRP